jgi:hypothetical protein
MARAKLNKLPDHSFANLALNSSKYTKSPLILFWHARFKASVLLYEIRIL